MAEEKQFNKVEDGFTPQTEQERETKEGLGAQNIEKEPLQSEGVLQKKERGPQLTKEQELNAQKEAERLREREYEGRRIEQLLVMAQEKGSKFAEKVARELAKDDPFLLDKFHDKLAENK